MAETKKRVRGGHKASATRMVTEVNALVEESAPDSAKLLQLKHSLEEKLKTFSILDSEILDMVAEDAIPQEIEEADLYKASIYEAIAKIDLCYSAKAKPKTTSTSASSAGPSRTPDIPTSASSRVKLPKLTLRPFNGDITAWTTFWDSYESAVHNNRELTDIDKFNYLRSLLEKSAYDCIAGLSLTAANYAEAITVLKKRFGNKQQIITKHMDILLRAEAVTSTNNLKGVRRPC